MLGTRSGKVRVLPCASNTLYDVESSPLRLGSKQVKCPKAESTYQKEWDKTPILLVDYIKNDFQKSTLSLTTQAFSEWPQKIKN